MDNRESGSTDQPPAESGLPVQPGVIIPWRELDVRASRSGGPGGQHVNTSSTRVEIVWNARATSALDAAQRARVAAALASRLDSAGALRVVASETRSQRQNRALAEERLAALVRHALVVKKTRKRTRPTRSSVEKRLSGKRRQAGKKRDRKLKPDD